MQRGQFTGRVGQHATQRHLSDVGEIGHAQRVTDLEVELELAGLRVGPGGVHPVEVAVDPVHGRTVDMEPAAAVDPLAPFPGPGHRRVDAGDLLGELSECGDIELGPVVQAQVDV